MSLMIVREIRVQYSVLRNYCAASRGGKGLHLWALQRLRSFSRHLIIELGDFLYSSQREEYNCLWQ